MSNQSGALFSGIGPKDYRPDTHYDLDAENGAVVKVRLPWQTDGSDFLEYLNDTFGRGLEADYNPLGNNRGVYVEPGIDEAKLRLMMELLNIYNL